MKPSRPYRLNSTDRPKLTDSRLGASKGRQRSKASSQSESDSINKYTYQKTKKKEDILNVEKDDSATQIKQKTVDFSKVHVEGKQSNSLLTKDQKDKQDGSGAGTVLDSRPTLKIKGTKKGAKKEQTVGQQIFKQKQIKMMFDALINGTDAEHPNEITKISLMSVISNFRIQGVNEELLPSLINFQRTQNQEQEKDTLNYEEFKKLFLFVDRCKQF